MLRQEKLLLEEVTHPVVDAVVCRFNVCKKAQIFVVFAFAQRRTRCLEACTFHDLAFN